MEKELDMSLEYLKRRCLEFLQKSDPENEFNSRVLLILRIIGG
jgi:hypothetical protein